MPVKENTRDLKVFIVLLSVSALLVLCLDIWQIVTGRVDPNKHLPFLMPIALFALAGIVWRIKRHFETSDPDDQQEILNKAHEDSFLNKNHLPTGRYKDDSIG